MESKRCYCLTEYCLEKRDKENDETFAQFQYRFEEWLNQIPDSYKDTVLTLVKNTVLFSHKDVNEFFPVLHDRLMGHHGITEDNTVYAFLKSRAGYSNSSNDYWTEYKLINKMNKHTFIVDLNKITEEAWDIIENIVYIDDFSGSGSAFISEIKQHIEIFTGKRVFFVTVAIMDWAIKSISSFAAEHNIDFIPISIFRLEKAFEQSLFQDNRCAHQQIKAMSIGFNISKDYIMGYNDSQALVVFYNNTPNNTLGFIWWNNSDSYSPLFPRNKDKRPTWQRMRANKNRKANANYNNALNRGK